MRALFIFILFLFAKGTALAAPSVYWVEFYSATRQIPRSIEEQIQKLHSEHKISSLIRVQIVEVQSRGGEIDWAPHLMVVYQGRSKDFDALHSNATYLKLKQALLSKVDSLSTLVGVKLRADGLKYLEKAPMAALILAADQTEPSERSLSLSITGVIASKGPLSPFVRSIKQVQILPLSFDDNPMDFMPAESNARGLGLIGEIIR